MITILIADDHPMVREGLKKTLSEEPDIRILGEARNAQETRALVAEHDADVLVLDISMPGTSGLSLLQDVLRLKKDLRVLILSVHPEERFAIRALKEGAAGYLTKESAPEELAQAIRKITTGRRYISPTLAEKLVEELQSDNAALPHELLSEREYEIFLMIAGGKTVSAIAEELSLSVATVSTHRRRILEKMGLSTNADIVQYAYANKLMQ
jgi:two-component system invasion response regulator UvrY